MDLKGKRFENSRLGFEIFVYEVEGKEMFIGRDVADILGYSDVSATISKKVDLEYKRVLYVKTLENIGNCQNGNSVKLEINNNIAMINEFGLYQLVCSSKLKEAKVFQQWVYEEVLPSLRKNNYYIDKENITDNKECI